MELTEETITHSKITINNHHYGTITLSPIFHKTLRELLSYKEEGVEFSPRFKTTKWDGVNYLLSKAGKFHLGLLDRVLEFCEYNEIEIEIEDNRKYTDSSNKIDILTRLGEQDRLPRDYQTKALEAAIKSKYRRGIIKAATGSGKSLIASMMVANYNTTTIIYVMGLDLLNQFHKDLSSIFDEEIGYIGNGVVNIKKINIASIWTLGAALDIPKKNMLLEDNEIDELPSSQADKVRINKLLKEAKLHIIDECHISSCSTLQSIYKSITPMFLFGLSGTPFKGVENDLLTESLLGKALIDIDASSLIERGILAKPVIKYVNVPNMGKQGNTYLEIYKNYIAENEIRNNLIVSESKKLMDKNYTVLVLFKNIKHGNIIRDKFELAGIPYYLLSGKDSLETRDSVKEAITNGERRVIISSTVLDIGFDLPRLSALVLAGGGKSYVKTLQRVGRVIRKYPGKKMAAIVEFFDNCKYLKAHSLKRYEIYRSEPAFKIIPCEAMKKFILE